MRNGNRWKLAGLAALLGISMGTAALPANLLSVQAAMPSAGIGDILQEMGNQKAPEGKEEPDSQPEAGGSTEGTGTDEQKNPDSSQNNGQGGTGSPDGTQQEGGSTDDTQQEDNRDQKEETPPESQDPAPSPAETTPNEAVESLLKLKSDARGTTAEDSVAAIVDEQINRIRNNGKLTGADLDRMVSTTTQQVQDLIKNAAETPKPTPPGNTGNNNTGGSSSGSVSDNSKKNEYITDKDREDADQDLVNYKNSLIKRENPEEYIIKQLDDILYSGIYYIANSEKMTPSEMWAYVSTVKGQMDAAVGKSGEVTTTSEFLTLADNWTTPSVSYGQEVDIVLPIINLGEDELTDLIVQPVVDIDVNKWPFEPDSTGYVQNFLEIPGCATRLYEEAVFNRRELTYHFKVREDVLTGYYPLTFQVWYSKDGIRCAEPAEVKVYVHTQGKPGSGTIGMSEQTNVSQPRIIVTGFETTPSEVYAGDTFTVTIHVHNTSKDTAVRNVLFDMEAVESGTEANTSYAVFLPTSGSSSIYVERMEPDSTKDIEIEMTAKTDLTQKPYVLTVKMKYDTDLKADLEDTANVSIPVLQEDKYDTSTPEVAPAAISVGEESNIMFQIYNTGKTNLYNLQVKYEGASIEGGEVFIGNLKPGETGNVDSMVRGIAATADDGKIRAIISFENGNGEVKTFEKEMELFVSEPMMDDMGNMDMMEPMEPEENKPSVLMIVGIAAGAVIAAAAVITLLLKFRKKKKAAAQLAEDLMDLDQD